MSEKIEGFLRLRFLQTSITVCVARFVLSLSLAVNHITRVQRLAATDCIE